MFLYNQNKRALTSGSESSFIYGGQEVCRNQDVAFSITCKLECQIEQLYNITVRTIFLSRVKLYDCVVFTGLGLLTGNYFGVGRVLHTKLIIHHILLHVVWIYYVGRFECCLFKQVSPVEEWLIVPIRLVGCNHFPQVRYPCIFDATYVRSICADKTQS